MTSGIIEIREIRGGSRATQKKLREVIRKVKNPRVANKRVSVWLLRWVNENFKSQGGKVGGWKPFKLGGRKIAGGGIDRSAKLLQDTGRLRQSFSPFHSRTVAGIGTDLNYAITHEFGLPHKNLPARRMLPLDTDRQVTLGIIKIYDHYIRSAVR